jgi:hypothetical protein
VEPRPAMRRAFSGLNRFLATPRLAKHRLFVWLPTATLPDSQLIVFARDDDYFFGVLHSSVHEVWARGLGTQLREVESGFRYTPTTTFETFPMPQPSPETAEVVVAAARELNELREGWLNPPGADTAQLPAANPNHPLQPAANLAGPGARAAGPGCPCRLRVAVPAARRGDPRATGRPQPAPVRGAGRRGGHPVGNLVRQATWCAAPSMPHFPLLVLHSGPCRTRRRGRHPQAGNP